MPPTNPWGKNKQQRNQISPGSPGPKVPVPTLAEPKPSGPKSQYEEIQEDELIVLESVYQEDFKRIETGHGAWKVCQIGCKNKST